MNTCDCQYGIFHREDCKFYNEKIYGGGVVAKDFLSVGVGETITESKRAQGRKRETCRPTARRILAVLLASMLLWLSSCADVSYGGFHSRTFLKDPKVKIVRITLKDGTEIYLEGAESPVSEAFKSGMEIGKNLTTVMP